MQKAIDNFLKFLVIILTGALGGILVINKAADNFYNIQQQAISQPNYSVEEKTIYIQENTALEQAIKKVESSVLAVESLSSKGKEIFGSGLILTSDGLVATLAEIIPQGYQFKFFVENETPEFKILKRNLDENLALIKVEKDGLKTAGFFDLEKLNLGKRIFLIGKIKTENFLPVSFIDEGIVSNFDSQNIKTNIRGNENYLGAPVFDIEGNVLGLSYLDKNNFVNIIPISKIKNLAGL